MESHAGAGGVDQAEGLNSVDDHEVVREVAADLRQAVAPYRTQFPEVTADFDKVAEMLDSAANSLDPEGMGGADRSAAEALVREAERVLRDELGQMGMPFLPQDLRYAALDAHKVLYRQILS